MQACYKSAFEGVVILTRNVKTDNAVEYVYTKLFRTKLSLIVFRATNCVGFLLPNDLPWESSSPEWVIDLYSV